MNELNKLWESNAFGDIGGWGNLTMHDLRCKCIELKEHWLDLGWEIESNSREIVAFLLEKWKEEKIAELKS